VMIPEDAGFINVKDNGAKGDGKTDDTKAIQRAINEGRKPGVDYSIQRSVYFPAGTYLVSDTLHWHGCCMTLQGQGSGATVIKLKDSASGFNNSADPKPVIFTPAGNMSFYQYIYDLTVDTGQNNPGAIGIDYVPNNIAALRNIVIRSGDKRGFVGLDMSRKWPGPCLVKNVNIQGFNYGIRTRQSEYGLTFENITLTNQGKAGFRNEGNTVAIRKLHSENRVSAVQNSGDRGMVILLDSDLRGGTTAAASAIDNSGYLYARNVLTQGYKSAIRNKGTAISGSKITEYVSGQIYSLFNSPKRSLDLPIEETPDYKDNNMANWGRFRPRNYGDTEGLQALLNSGKSTIYFRANADYLGKRIVTIPSTVKRIIGFNTNVHRINKEGVIFKVTENSKDPLIIEQFKGGITVEHASARTVVIKDGNYRYLEGSGAGKLFLENVGTPPPLSISGKRSVWARQLNTESQKPFSKISNNGAKLWILGLKTEGTSTTITTSGGGFTELLGTLLYPVHVFKPKEQLNPAFINTESSQSLIYSLSVYGSGRNYKIQVQETKGGVVRQLRTSQIKDGRMPLFVGYQ
jgi:hypothetical protein